MVSVPKHVAGFYMHFSLSTNFTFEENYFIKHMILKNFLLSPLTKNSDLTRLKYYAGSTLEMQS